MLKEKFINLKNNQETFDELIEVVKTSLNEEEVFYALLKQAEILFEYEEYKKTNDILLKLYEDKGVLEDKYLKLLIDSLINSDNKPEAMYFINLRKESLSQLDMYLHYLDLLKYKEAFNEDFYPLLNTLKAYSFNKKILSSYYIKKFNDVTKNNNELVEETYIELLTLNLEDNDKEEMDELYFNYLLKTNKDIKEFLNNQKGLSLVYYQLILLMKDEELRRVQILEAEKEKELDDLSTKRQVNLYQLLKDFYNKHNDLKSYDLYSLRLEHATKELKKELRPKRKRTLILPKEDIKEIVKVDLKETKKEEDLKGERFILIEKFMAELLKLELNLTLFERLRSIGIILEKHFDFSDIVFYTKPHLYHYKVNRLYEKKYNQATLNSTIIGVAAKEQKDIVGDVGFLEFDYDVLTNKSFLETDIKQVYCYGLDSEFSVCFYQREKQNLLNHDLLFKFVSQIIYYDLNYDKHISKVKEEYEIINNLFKNKHLMAFVYKNKFYGSSPFNEVFKLRPNDNLDTLVLRFDTELRIKYNALLNQLRKKDIEQFQIDLHYEGIKYVVDHFMYKGYVYGIFTEVSDKVDKLKQWQEKAFVDPLSQLLTLHEFEVNFPKYTRGKSSFVLMELSGLNKIESLYGKKIKRDFFLEFTDHCKDEFNQVYLFDQNSILGVLNINDVRSVENKIKAFIEKIKDIKSNILKEQSFNVFMGVIRYPINTRERRIERIYQYLSLSLLKAKTINKKDRYSYFDFKDYEQDLFDTEMIRQIDSLITKEKLLLSFTQIVNQKTNLVASYEVGVRSNTLHVYEEYYYQVAEKRGMLEKLEKYVLTESFKVLKKINDETGKYIKLTINISGETLNSPRFAGFLISLYRTYSVPYELVELKVNLKRFKQEEYMILEELYNYGVIIGTDNLDYINRNFISIFHLKTKINFENSKMVDYLKFLKSYLDSQNMNLVVYNVDSLNEKEKLKDLNVEFIRGKTVDTELYLEEILKMLK